MKLKACVLIACLALAATAGSAAAWDIIGSRDVAIRTDHDTIRLEGHHAFSRLKLCVINRPVHFYEVSVTFENGESQQLHVAERINPGRCTRPLDLVGGRRDIAHIDFTYETAAFRHRTATVRVLAE